MITNTNEQDSSPESEESSTAVRACVRRFYDAARADDLLGPVFNHWIKDWDAHLARMDDFWSDALLGTRRYESAPFPPHLKLKMTQEHFDRWNKLWSAAVEATLRESIASKAKAIGDHMAHCWGRAYLAMTGSESRRCDHDRDRRAESSETQHASA